MAAITALSYISANLALAETKFVDFTISSNGNQNFQSLVQQAETLATSLLKQQFAENSSITDVAVTVVGEHNEQEVLLLLQGFLAQIGKQNLNLNTGLSILTE